MTPKAKPLSALVLTVLLCGASATNASAQVRWNAGAPDCVATPQPPLQVHAYDEKTFILRQSPCADPEANFIYLLIGDERALLIDTGAVADPRTMPLARTVVGLLPDMNGAKLPLLVVHTHGHNDHDAGDGQFASLAGVEIVPAELASVRRYFAFPRWPEGQALIDLGGRSVEAIPAPGHHENHVVFHDRRTGLLFTGDFLLPGRLMIDDIAAYRQSARRIAAFAGTRDITHVMGAHIELDASGRLYPFGSSHHPHERRLELTKADVLALPVALEDFNGFYARHPAFILSNPLRNLIALAAAALVVVVLGAWGLRRWLRWRRRPA